MTSQGEVRVRPATMADRAGVIACVEAAYGKYLPVIGRRPAPMVADYSQLISDGGVRVAESGGSVVGVLVMWPQSDHLYVDNIGVHPDAQGTGVGQVLLDAAETAALDAGLDEIRLYTNEAMTENLGYYPRRGYVETHRAEADGFRRVYFSKRV